MKKLIALILALNLVFALAACGTSTDPTRIEDPTVIESVTEAPTEAATEVPTEALTETPTEAPTEEPTEAPTETPTEATNDADISMGVTADNTYRSEFLGLGCTLGSDWTFYSEDQLLTMSNITASLIPEDLAKAIESAQYYFDMYAANQKTGSSVNVVMNNIGLLYGTLINMDTFIEASISQITSGMEQIGATDVTAVQDKFQLAGNSYDGINIACKINGADFYETQVEIVKGGYIASITFAGLTQTRFRKPWTRSLLCKN